VRSRPRAGLVVLGLALISLTPMAPRLVRWPELLAVQLFRPLDALVVQLRKRSEVPASEPILEQDLFRIRRGLDHRNQQLLSGARSLAPDRPHLLARVVEVDLRLRRLLVDAGEDAEIPVGAPVLAGNYGIGRVVGARHGVAVVETPWTPEARFAGACGGERREVRVVLSGLDRSEWSASVQNPESKSGLTPGEPVFVPDVRDLLLDDWIQLLPAGLRLGRLAEDQTLARTGQRAYCVVPELDLMLLDAVVVIAGQPGDRNPVLNLESTRVNALWCGLASPWRDGLILTGFGLPEQGSVSVDGRFAGIIESQLIDVARVRGVSDPGERFPVLLVGDQRSTTLLLESVKTWASGARFRVLAGEPIAEPGDLLLTAGRGPHVPRGFLIGRVTFAQDGLLELSRRPLHEGSAVLVWRRPGFPARPWEPES